MADIAFRIGTHIFIHGTAVLAVAWFVVRYGGGPAARRHATWTTAFLVLLALPLGYSVVPGWDLGFLLPGTQPVEQLNVEGGRVEVDGPAGEDEPSLDAAQDRGMTENVVSSASPPPPNEAGRWLAFTRPMNASQWIPGVQSIARVLAGGFLLVWLAGIVVLGARLGIGVIVLWRREQSTVSAGCDGLVDELASQLGLDRSFAVRCSPTVQVPMVWGLWSPTILLPEAAMDWPTDRMKSVLLHEFAHVKRRDDIAHAIARVTQILFWVNPLIWFACRRARAAQEQACDDAVLRSGVESWVYAEHLLGIAKTFRQCSSFSQGVALSSGEGFKSRMGALLSSETSHRGLTRWEGGSLLLAGMVLLAAVSGVQFGWSSSGESMNERHWIEAEATSLPENFSRRHGSDASEGEYVEVTGNVEGLDVPPQERWARYSFDAASDGRYLVWARVRVADNDTDSFWVRMNEGPWIRWNGIETGQRWHWVQLRDADRDGRLVAFDLPAGQHALEVGPREDGIAIDELVVTDDWEFRPRERGQETSSASPSHHIWMEAEEGWLQSPLHVANAPDASGWQYIEADLDNDDDEQRQAPPDAGHATYSFTVSEGGTYRLWGRVIAPSNGHDSFWVRMDDGDWIRWNEIRQGEGWHWDEVHDVDNGKRPVHFSLAEGEHELTLAYRERRVPLDRLLLTDDSTFRPRGTGERSSEAPPSFSRELSVREADVAPPMVRRTKSESGGSRTWIEVPSGVDDGPPAGGPGAATFRVSVPYDGDYVLWGEVIAPSDRENSFYVAVNGGDEVIWHTPGYLDTTTEWRWDPISDGRQQDKTDPVVFPLEAGTHQLRIRSREDGTRLRRLRITNVPVSKEAVVVL